MNLDNRTLRELVNRNVNVNGQDQETRTTRGRDEDSAVSIQSFLTLFGTQLTQRFPEIPIDLNLDTDEIRLIADFSIACTVIAEEVWQRVSQTSVMRNSPVIARQTRAA